MKLPGFALALLIAVAAAGVLFYERQLLELRAELEQTRLREAQATAALKARSERAAAEARMMSERAAAEARAMEKAATIAAAKPPLAPSVFLPPSGAGGPAASLAAMAQPSAREQEARRQSEEARQEAARRALEQAERKSPLIKEPYRPDPGPYSASLAPLLEEAAALETAGRGSAAVEVYERAARSGSGKAALRLSEIYDRGIPGVAPDYRTSLKWRNAARVLGEDVPLRR